VINTAEYFDSIQDSLVLTVKATATNVAQMQATDTRVIRVVKKACDGPPCVGEPTVPTIRLTEVGRDHPKLDNDPCLHSGKTGRLPQGGFRPLAIREGPINPFDIQACLDQERGTWKFKVSQIQINVFLSLCEDNLLGFRIVDDISTLSNSEACNALHDILGHYEYPVQTTLGYVFRRILLKHEQGHKQDYEDALKKVQDQFEEDLRKVSIKCEEVNNLNDAVEKARVAMIRPINSFLTRAYAQYLKITSRPNYEQDTQRSLFNDIIAIRNQLVEKCASGGRQ